MKVHFFVQFVYKQGTYFRFHNFALGLKNLGHDVVVYGAVYSKGETSRVEYNDGIEYDITACYFPFQSFFGQWQHPYSILKRLFRRYPVSDVSHVFQPFGSAYAAWYFNRKRSKLNVYDWDDLWTDGLLTKENNFLSWWTRLQVSFIEKKSPKIANITTVCSKYLALRASNNGADCVNILYNGFWNTNIIGKNEARKLLALDQNALYIGFMGRTVNEINWCFELLTQTYHKFPLLRLALCGMPTEVLDALDPEIKGRIDYLGFLSPENARYFATALDLGLLPLEDGHFNQSRFPIKFAEYLSVNLPILCTDVGECATIAEKYSFVRLTQPNYDSWVVGGFEVLEKIINGTWSKVDSDLINTTLSWKAISSDLEKIYLNV